jgi:tetratricopeptide (TPR) repeat protein
LGHLLAASKPPSNLNEVRHPLMNENNIDYWLGIAYAGLERHDEARAAWERAARSRSDFQRMQLQPVSESTFWSGMALNRLRRYEEAQQVFDSIAQYAEDLSRRTPKIDYFATSLPTMLLFEEDLYEYQQITADFLRAQALIGRNSREDGSGIALLEAVLQRDCSHTGAIDLLRIFKG